MNRQAVVVDTNIVFKALHYKYYFVRSAIVD